MAEKKVEREVGREFTLAGKRVKKGAKVQITPKMEKYLDGLADSPLAPLAPQRGEKKAGS